MSRAVRQIASRDLHVDGPGGRLFVRVWSPAGPDAGVPLILFHDSLGSVALWRDFPARLCASTGRQVIAYDRLGFGQSDAHPGRLPPDFIAGEAEGGFAAVCRQLGIGRCVLFGHSVGGGMAVNCAAVCGEDCVALVTESAQAFVEDRTLRGVEAARELFRDPGQVERLKRHHGAKAAWVLDAWIGTWLDPAFASWSLAAALPRVKCPVLAIHGLEDEYGSARHPELIGRLAGGSVRLELMAATRHVPHREREDAVVGMVAEFLQGLACRG